MSPYCNAAFGGMQPSQNKFSGGKRGIVLLTILLASVRVDSWCLEKDCRTNKSIRVVNATTAECITCFPCLECLHRLPSVACGSTVPYGTDIQCVDPTHPDPLLRPSPSTTSEILESLQPATLSVTLSHSSHLTSSSITSNPPLAIHATGSKDSTYLSSYAIPTATNSIPEKTTSKPLFPSETFQKQHHSTLIGTVIGVLLICVFVVIFCYCWRQITAQKNKHWSANDQDNDTCEGQYLSTNSATSSSFQENIDKQQNQPGGVYTVLKERSGGSPMRMLDSASAEGDQDFNDLADEDSESDDDDLVDLSPDLPIIPQQPPKQTTVKIPQATFQVNILVGNADHSWTSSVSPPHNQLQSHCLDVWSENAVISCQRMCTNNWLALSQEEKYLTKLLEVPSPLLQNISLLLDIERTDGQDVRSLADDLGVRFAVLQQAAKNAGESPTSRLLKEKFNGTVGDFVEQMKRMKRDDIITKINEWYG